MPRKAINYDETIIYKIVCNSPPYVFVGHTTEYVQRKHAHKKESLKSEARLYQMIRASGGWESCQIVPIKVYPCKSSIEAQIEEDRLRVELTAN